MGSGRPSTAASDESVTCPARSGRAGRCRTGGRWPGGVDRWSGHGRHDVSVGSPGTVICTFTGAAQYWTVPAGVTQAQFFVFGAEGGPAGPGVGGAPGMGGEVSAVLPVSPGEVLQVNLGRAGVTNTPQMLFGGGVSLAGSGGGASDVRSPAVDGSYPLEDRLLVAGGGGGGAGGAGGVPANSAPPAAAPAGGNGGNADSGGSPGVSVNLPPIPTGGVLIGGQGGLLAGTITAALGGTAAGSQPCAWTPGAVGAVGSLGAGGVVARRTGRRRGTACPLGDGLRGPAGCRCARGSSRWP